MAEKHSKAQHVVDFDTFAAIVRQLRSFRASVSLDDQLLRVVYEALDDDADSLLTRQEFQDMCEVLQTSFRLTRRDSRVRLMLAGSGGERLLHRLMNNGTKGPEMGFATPAWMRPKFDGSPFDRFMNAVLILNVVWLLAQSFFDLNDVAVYGWFATVDILFSFVYVVEVALKFCWWSIEEYWTSLENRFDFATTCILAGGGIAVLFFNVNREVVRYLNLLRVVRLLKALNVFPAWTRMVSIILRMVATCGDVLAMNFLMVYLWSAWGQWLFGGQLYKSNPLLAGVDLDYFGSHFEVYNFNDMFLGAVTMFFVTITGWVDAVALACLALYSPYSVNWCLAWSFWLSFYVGSVLIAFNVWTAFSIDVFCTLGDMSKAFECSRQAIDDRMFQKMEEYAEQGQCLHIRPSAALSRERVYAHLFSDEDGEEGAEGQSEAATGAAAGKGAAGVKGKGKGTLVGMSALVGASAAGSRSAAGVKGKGASVDMSALFGASAAGSRSVAGLGKSSMASPASSARWRSAQAAGAAGAEPPSGADWVSLL